MFQLRPFWRSAVLAAFLLTACSESVAAPDELPAAPPLRPHDVRTFFVPDGQPTFTALAGATAYHGIHQGLHLRRADPPELKSELAVAVVRL